MVKQNIKEKSITKNLIANVIKTLMTVLFPLITFPYASRILGASGIGRVNYANSIITYFSLLAALGITIYAVREGARIRDDKEMFNKFAQEMLRINLCTTLITYVAFIVFLCIPVLKGYKGLLLIFSASILFTTIGMEWLFVVQEEYAYITKRAILFQLVSLVLLFLLVKTKSDDGWYAALTVISSGGSAIMNLWYSRKFVDWKKRYQYEYCKHLKPIFLIFGTSIASNIYMTMDTTMLGAMRGDTATGIYTAAVKINLMVSTLIGVISTTILPRVSYYIGKNLRAEYEKIMKTSMNILLLISVPAAIGMMCTSDVLILLFSEREFISGSLAAKILSAKVVVAAVNRILAYQICIPHQKDREVLISTISGAVFNLAANGILISLFGVTGAAIATLCSECVVFAVLTKYCKNIFETKRMYHRLPLYFFASIGFFAVRWGVNQVTNSILYQLFATMIICFIGYLVILLLMKDPYLQELSNALTNRIHKKG